MAQNEYMQVKDVLSEAVKLKKNNNYRKARKLLSESLDDYPDNKYLKASLADTLYRLNELEEALNLAEQVLKENPGDSRALIVKGNVNFNKRNYKKALDFFKEARTNNDSNYLISRIIRTHLKLKEYEQALDICQKQLDQDPENTVFQKLMASIYEKASRYYEK